MEMRREGIMHDRRWTIVNVMLGVSLLTLAGLNIQLAMGHNWDTWHWHTGRDILTYGPRGNYTTEASRALSEWDVSTDVNFPGSSSLQEMAVYGYNYGGTGWAGLATVEGTYDNHGKHITQCKARYNTYYNKPWWDPGWWTTSDSEWRRGVYCQEIGHCLGLSHSDDGCMGMGYYNKATRTTSHNRADVNAKF